MERQFLFSSKKPRKNPKARTPQLTIMMKDVLSLSNQSITQQTHKIMKNFLLYYDLDIIDNIYQKSTQDQKSAIIKSIQFKTACENECLLLLISKKQYKEIFVLLEGSISYKYYSDNKMKIYELTQRRGQILNDIIIPEVPFKHLSLVTSSPSILMRIPINIYLCQQIWRKKEENRVFLMNSFENISSDESKFKLQNLMPYFMQRNYNRQEIIYLNSKKISTLNFIGKGQVEIIKQASNKKPISVIRITQGKFFYFDSANNENQFTTVKCKSTTCTIFSIPLFIFKEIAPPSVKEAIAESQMVSESIYKKLVKKNQKIAQDPSKFLKIRRKKKGSKNKDRKSQKQNQSSWDLIEHFANKMNLKLQLPSELIRKTTQSAHASPRQHSQYSFSNRIQKLKRKVLNAEKLQPPQQTLKERAFSDGFKTTLSTNFRTKSSFFSPMNRVLNTKPIVENRMRLVKKTRYKLLRYAKGQNLYGLSDYI